MSCFILLEALRWWKEEEEKHVSPSLPLRQSSLCLTIFTQEKDKDYIQPDAQGFLQGTKKYQHVTCLHLLEALQMWVSYIWHNHGCRNRLTHPPPEWSFWVSEYDLWMAVWFHHWLSWWTLKGNFVVFSLYI